MKAILVISDGMADRPIKELGLKTPLEAAVKPNLDRVAKNGVCGIMDPIAPGIPPGSDTATLALLGYDPSKVYSGRGALEAEGSGVEVLPGDVAFRCNFATVNDDLVVLDRRAGRIATATISCKYPRDHGSRSTAHQRHQRIVRFARKSQNKSNSFPSSRTKSVSIHSHIQSIPHAKNLGGGSLSLNVFNSTTVGTPFVIA